MKIKFIHIIGVLSFFTLTPLVASAQTTSGCLPNPLGVSSISDLLGLVVTVATYIGVVLAVVFLIYAGFKYISAQGNPEKIREAHHFLLSVVIGIAILIGAGAIVTVIENTLTSAGLTNTTTFGAPSSNTSSSNCGNATGNTSAPAVATPAPAAVAPTATPNTSATAAPLGGFQSGGGSFGGAGAGGSY